MADDEPRKYKEHEFTAALGGLTMPNRAIKNNIMPAVFEVFKKADGNAMRIGAALAEIDNMFRDIVEADLTTASFVFRLILNQTKHDPGLCGVALETGLTHISAFADNSVIMRKLTHKIAIAVEKYPNLIHDVGDALLATLPEFAKADREKALFAVTQAFAGCTDDEKIRASFFGTALSTVMHINPHAGEDLAATHYKDMKQHVGSTNMTVAALPYVATINPLQAQYLWSSLLLTEDLDKLKGDAPILSEHFLRSAKAPRSGKEIWFLAARDDDDKPIVKAVMGADIFSLPELREIFGNAYENEDIQDAAHFERVVAQGGLFEEMIRGELSLLETAEQIWSSDGTECRVVSFAAKPAGP